MRLDPEVINIIEKVFVDKILTKDEIFYLLNTPDHSIEAGFIMASADSISRNACDGKAEVHAQIGINLSPCLYDCKFCAFAAQNKIFNGRNELSIEEITQSAMKAEREQANAIFLMATGDYPFDKFIEISEKVREKLKPETIMIANIGDFDYNESKRLKEVGYTGIYHAVRMGEGKDTKIDPKTRFNTIRAAQKAGLLIGTCVEPVGPEHSIDELVEKILIGKEMKPCYSGVMRRIQIPNSELSKYGIISEYRLAFLVAVVRLVMGKKLIGNCTHEPNILGPISGANLFWAEVGANPRDTTAETSKSRGLDVKSCVRIFNETDFSVRRGPSLIYNKNAI
ncbi:radical SAM protein [[Eubacterium] cellulosolvens]